MIWTYPAVVLRTVDGDTLVAELDLGMRILTRRSVRALAINAPERRTDPAGWEAARRLAAALLPDGTAVTIRSRQLDSFGRVLGDITLPDGSDFAALMLNSGLVDPYRPT